MTKIRVLCSTHSVQNTDECVRSTAGDTLLCINHHCDTTHLNVSNGEIAALCGVLGDDGPRTYARNSTRGTTTIT